MAYKFLLFIIFSVALTTRAQTDVLHLKSNVTDTIFGNVVEDPYRWMEDIKSDSLNNWLKEQKKIAKAEQAQFKGRMGDVAYNRPRIEHEQYDVERSEGRFYRWSWSHRFSIDSRVLYSRRNLDENFKVAFDPGQVNWKQRSHIDFWACSDSSKYMAVSLTADGSDWQQIRVSDLDSSLYFEDAIGPGKFSGIVWWGNGFFYGRYPDGGRWDSVGTQKLYYHKLGDKQDKDQVITSSPSGTDYRDIRFWVTTNKRYLVIGKNQKIGNTLYGILAYKDLNDGLDAPFKHIIKTPVTDTCRYNLVDYADSGFLIYTDYLAPNGRIMRTDMERANHFFEVVPESERVLKKVTWVGHQLVALYNTAGHYSVSMYNDTGGLLNTIRFSPELTISGFRGLPTDTETFFYEYSFYTPPIVYRYSFNTGKFEPVEKTKIAYNPDNYHTEIVTCKASDGTDIPMYLTYKKGFNRKANNPVILAGHGGFGRSVTPTYNYDNIIFFESGGILAVPMIRGGGEEGGDWHAGGRRFGKQHAFDDFTSAAQYLIKEGYTSKDHLALLGDDDGGLLVTTVMVQHPDLCKVVVARSGIFDMLRFQKFTYGKYWRQEYGNPDYQPDFKNLLSYSPLHNLKPGVNYPATLLVAHRTDERAVPQHSFKFMARLQECSTPDNPHVLFFAEDFEHTQSTGYIDPNDTDPYVLAFIFTQMHLPIKYGF